MRADWPGRELNIEGYPSEGFLTLCESARPDQVTLVPDDPSQVTSDHGFDVAAHATPLAEIIERLHNGNIRVSVFVDAHPTVPAIAAEVGADRIELYTGPYGDPRADTGTQLSRLKATADAARKLSTTTRGKVLGLNAGHDLTLDNLPALTDAIPDLMECSIGHALTADALRFGFPDAVRRYVRALASN